VGTGGKRLREEKAELERRVELTIVTKGLEAIYRLTAAVQDLAVYPASRLEPRCWLPLASGHRRPCGKGRMCFVATR
jgi:hypothetical protein